MPFSNTAVFVNPNDRVQVRYPTPSTWNTQVTVNVRIGTGNDPDGITFGTKIPDALPQSFTFDNQSGFTGPFNGTSSSGSTSTFQKNTTYYSQVIEISDIEIPIPASISAVSNGPKNNNTNNTTAQFRIYRGGSFDSWRTSISANIAEGTGGLQPGDKIQLRVTTPNWYTSSTVVTFNVGDETFGTDIGQPSTSFSRTWAITTRAQDQNITQYVFTDYVDQKTSFDPGWAFTGTELVASGDGAFGAPGTGEMGGFVTPDGSGYLFMGSFGPTLVANRTATLGNIDTTKATKLVFNVIAGNDSNGGERPNDSTEAFDVVIDNGSTTREVELIPTASGYPGGFTSFDVVEGSWHDVTVNLNADEKIEDLELQFKSKAGPGEFRSVIPSAVQTANINSNDAYALRYIKIYNGNTLIDTIWAMGDGGPSYVYQTVPISNIDSDVVLRATATGNLEISTNQYEWTTTIGSQLVLGDNLYTRLRVGPNYTQKRTGTLNVFATGGATYTRGGNSYENNNTSTYGSGDYQVSQSLGSVTDNWQSWTEVDRYPDAIEASPIYTYGVKVENTSVGTGFTPNQNYDVSGGSGSGMVIFLGNSFTEVDIVDPGYGYTIGNTITLTSPSGGDNAVYTISEYEKVRVSNLVNYTKAEPGFYYFADIPVTGLGTEYSAGTYDNLEVPFTNLANNSPVTAKNRVASLNGTNVKMTAIIDGTGGELRKNNTGAWVQQLTVEENDVITVKRRANTTFGATQTLKLTLKGPPDGNPSVGNPTDGPSPSYPNKTTTMVLVTRGQRNTPYPFRANPVYLSNPGQEQIAEVEIRGLDVSTTATITSGVGSLSVDQINWGSSVSINPAITTLYVRQNASNVSGGLAQLTYQIGSLSDTFRIYTRQFNVLGDFITETWFGQSFTDYTEFVIPAFAGEQFYLTMVGAGGGDGGGDVPNSTGGPGGSGNVLRVLVEIPRSAWPTVGGEPDYTLRIYPADSGEDGASFVSNTGGGAGGFGYAYGGNGGNAGPGDSSGAGGGGGGASAVTFTDNVLIALAGGGGGGAGAGNDTTIPEAESYGNHTTNGTIQTTTVNLNLPGDNAPNATGQGGGPGGGGGGYDGSAGTLNTSKSDSGGVLQTNDLDATGGNGGGAYYNTTYCSLLQGNQLTGQGAAPGASGAVYIEYSQQDTEPDAYSFDVTDGATIQQTVFSSIEQITGITGTVPASVSAPGFTADLRICDTSAEGSCGPWESGAQIGNNQYIQIRATTGNQFFTTYTVAVTVGDATSYWDINTGPPPDSDPNPFFFNDEGPVPINTLVVSEEQTISGITVPVTVTATNNAEVRVDGGSWFPGSTGTTIENGQTLEIRLLSSSDYEDTVTTEITVGTGDPVEWNVVTDVELDSTPDSFTWIYELGANLLTEYESNTEIINGIETVVDFIVESGPGDGDPSGELPRIKKNNVLLPAGVTQTTVERFDTLALVYTTTDVIGETRIFNTKLGLASSTDGYFETLWSVRTAGQFGTDPDDFSFASVIASGTGAYAEAEDGGTTQVVTISGLSTGVVIPLFGNNGIEFDVNNTGYNVYTISSPANVTNGSFFTVRLRSSEIPGFTRTAQVFAGSFNTSFSVQSPASIQDPINSQWYSSITPCKYIGNTFSGAQIRINTKFDGLPVGSIMPVFQDGTQDDGWGNLTGSAASRFPSWVYCDGSYYNPNDYPLLFETIGYDYGAKTVGPDTFFRVPDLRNRYVKGTGVIDGNSASSPGLNPTYTRTKQSGAPGNTQPGSFGGMWFVETIGDTANEEIEQVVEPATGQPAQESVFFGIAQVSTTGYPNVTGSIEFVSTGSAKCPIGLEPEKIYDVPLHFHDLISGVADPGNFKGRVNWGGRGGYGIDITSPNAENIGSPTVATFEASGSFSFNLWGYATNDYDLDSDNVPGSTACDRPGWWDGSSNTWFNSTDPGFEGTEEVGEYGSVTIQQNGIRPGSTEYNEINSYIDLSNQPFPGQAGAFGASNARKFVTTVDIPRKDITIRSYNPTNKLKHNHYVSLVAVEDTSVYGYGNNETGGTASAALNTFSGGINSTVDLEFSALDIGIQVLPGTFTLTQSKQLIPIPSFSPQDNVPLVTPYTWVKWLIKAF